MKKYERGRETEIYYMNARRGLVASSNFLKLLKEGNLFKWKEKILPEKNVRRGRSASPEMY